MSQWRTHTRNEHQAKIEATDRAVSLMIRERDRDEACIACGKFHEAYDAGHYRRRELMPTRFHPLNLNNEGTGCNRGTHNNKYGMKDMDLYRENIDKKWGEGMGLQIRLVSRGNINARAGTGRLRRTEILPPRSFIMFSLNEP